MAYRRRWISPTPGTMRAANTCVSALQVTPRRRRILAQIVSLMLALATGVAWGIYVARTGRDELPRAGWVSVTLAALSIVLGVVARLRQLPDREETPGWEQLRRLDRWPLETVGLLRGDERGDRRCFGRRLRSRTTRLTGAIPNCPAIASAHPVAAQHATPARSASR
jgi:hypothetical protein